MCPKCRGICNCSYCMKKIGQQPIGALSHSAKASGIKSVAEMLMKKASKDVELDKVNNFNIVPSNKAILKKDQVLAPPLRV
ncbi:uncharacterized protein LOC131647392 [Vicia villosa]|uniref:uncharacterized protein LOC131647391 n=1 Tax=Vicia villosa TaxID=3911 RepID=UPI00273C7916|nr:uncharacterized protein LOC131647391 [Vicia villosa]XP_058773273.1 uncharacterized protein LOC131647392 [Vicia villosa]